MTDQEISRVFSSNLRRLMARDGINQRELAKRVGASESSVSYWMNGVNVPRTGILQKLTEIFNCRPSDLLTEPGTQNAVPLFADENIYRIALAAREAHLTREQTHAVLKYMMFLYPEAFNTSVHK